MQKRSFSDVLRELEGGQLEPELTEALQSVVEAVREHKKAGGIDISLKFGATGRGMIAVASKVKVKKPEGERLGTTFFVGTDGTLFRDDPAQPRLPLRSATEQEPTEVRAVDTGAKALRVVE